MVMQVERLEQLLEYRFSSAVLVTQAVTHPSHAHEQGQCGLDYQRLEFLGDAVLGMVVAEMLFSCYPDRSEGDLSRFRSQMTDQAALAGIARKYGLGSHIQLGRGEEQSGGRDKDSILADVLEALLAAVYLDGGLEEVRRVITRLFRELLELPGSLPRVNDAKSELQELLSTRHLSPPTYLLVEESGPPHDRQFRFQVLVDGEVAGEGSGGSKKAAQQSAARQALEALFAEEQPL